MRRRGRLNTPSRQQQVARSLLKIQVKLPGTRRKVGVDPGVAEALSRYADRASQRTLAWAARQAMILRLDGGKVGTEFVLGFGQILDWAAAALSLQGDRTHKINLLSYTGLEAWLGQLRYHELLASVKDGQIEIPKGMTAYEVGAAVGVSPSMLRQVNHRGVAKARVGSWIWIGKPGPLEHRFVLTEYADGHAWVWIKPGKDKDRVGRNIGLCISATSYNRRLQFALVDAENRPWAVLTMLLVRPPGAAPANPNSFLSVQADPTGKWGTATLDVGKLLRDRVRVVWGECKGRFNKRPVPDPQRKYAIALVTSGLLGPLQVPERSSIAAADWAAILLVGFTPNKARTLWRKAGGTASIFSVADALRPTTNGDGGPGEHTINYFTQAPPGDWLRTALAPLVLAASTNDELQIIWREHSRDRPQLQEEILRVVQARKAMDTVFWQTALPLAKRQGLQVPAKALQDYRARFTAARSKTMNLRAAAVRRMLRKGMQGEVPKGLSVYDLFVAALDRGLMVITRPRLMASVFKTRRDLSANMALSTAISTFERLAAHDGDVAALNRADQAANPKTVFHPYPKTMTLRYLAMVAEAAAYAMMEVGTEKLTLEEAADFGEDDPRVAYDDGYMLADYLRGGEDGWHCPGCFGMNNDTAGIAIVLWPDLSPIWEFPHSDVEEDFVGSLLGYEGGWGEPMETIYDTVHGEGLQHLVDELGHAAPAILASQAPEDVGNIVWERDIPLPLRRALDRYKREMEHLGAQPDPGWAELLSKPTKVVMAMPGLTALEKMRIGRQRNRELVNAVRLAAGLQEDRDYPPNTIDFAQQGLPGFNRRG